MKARRTKPLWRVSLVTSPEAEEAAGEIMANLMGQPPVLYYDCESRTTTLSVYLDQPDTWTPAIRARLSAAVKGLRDFGLSPGAARLRFTKVRKEDWAESWKRHFQPLKIGKKLVVRPSWARLEDKFAHEVILDPGLSFGTGRHPTTEFCLRQIAHAELVGLGGGLLDMGTGTGILAIAAAKLGYTPVEAFDFDREAVAVASANARENGVLARILFTRRDLTKLPPAARRRFGVVCANLTANLLLAELDRILARLKPGGSLILAGILAVEFSQVRQACEHRRLELIKDRQHKEWHSGRFKSPVAGQ